MKKRFTRIISLILVTAMMCGTLCGKKEDSEAKRSGNVLTVGIPQNSNISDFDNNALTKYLEESLDIELEFVFFSSSADEYLQQITLMASSEKETLPDVLWGFWGLGRSSTNEFGEAGYFLDLKDLIEEHGTYFKEAISKQPEEMQQQIYDKITDTSNGAIYTLPYVSYETVDVLQSLTFINQKWLDKVGMSAPTTVDELKSVLKAFAEEDPNGNGMADELPMFSKASGVNDICTYIINAFVYYDTLNIFNVTDGKVWAPFASDEYRKAIIYMSELCTQGLLSDLSFTTAESSEVISLITPATGTAITGIFSGHPSSWTDPTSMLMEEYTALAPLKDATGKGGYNVARPVDILPASFITQDCANPEMAMKFLDFFYNDETVTRVRHGEKDVDWISEEGLDSYGNTVATKIVNGNAFFEGTSTWARNGNGIMTPQNYGSVAESDDAHENLIKDLLSGSAKTLAEWQRPTEVAADLIYTPEEEEVRSEYNQALQDYILSARNRFITGAIDPTSDIDWKEYIDTLSNLKYEELMKVTQDAYDRANK